MQVYLGKKVYRRNWSYPVEYIHLVSDSSPLIEKREQDNITAWQPTPEDLTACDWELQGDPNLEFDLEVGKEMYDDSQFFGYFNINSSSSSTYIGTLDLIKNNSDIKNITMFYFIEDSKLSIQASSDNNEESYQKMEELFSKKLTVMVDDVHYVLDYLQARHDNETTYVLSRVYDSHINKNLKKLGDLLKQNVGKTLRIRLVWNDH
ncbi:Thoeris anti-defense Tad2 family protein [Xenorhabdus ehlersii]|uniref:Thoeris anti-defense Tad2 family protein n=1 Tax=Xenorhabdus ehlersii TaxID=290111 RepID=UPI00237C4F84|nr:MW1434 family type I TA system toxin [Xenorhabdus ehlersii]